MESQELDVVERSVTSKMVKEPAGILGVKEARNVGAPATQDSFAPPKRKKEGKFWMMVTNWTN
jgi:hypothetical protein